MQNRNGIHAKYRIYHHGLIVILVKKELEAKDIAWATFLKEFHTRKSIEEECRKVF